MPVLQPKCFTAPSTPSCGMNAAQWPVYKVLHHAQRLHVCLSQGSDVAKGVERHTSCSMNETVNLERPLRRTILSAFGLLTTMCTISSASASTNGFSLSSCLEQFRAFLGPPDYSLPGPLQVVHLPRLEHYCIPCATSVGYGTLSRIDMIYPKRGWALGLGPPFPLALFTSGFLVGSEAYRSYADKLASYGYTVLLYDKTETMADTLDDVTSVRLLRDLIDWCAHDPLLRQLCDTSRVYLIGHSRGGKISALAAAQEPRVAALCLIDPVDNTIYAPLAPGYPSALTALRSSSNGRPLPVAVVGSGLAGECAPRASNYRRFFEANSGPTWEVNIQGAGHFQFLDRVSALQRAVCPAGEEPEGAVHTISQAVMLAWGEAMVRHAGQDVLQEGTNPYPLACQRVEPPPFTTTSLPQLPRFGIGRSDAATTTATTTSGSGGSSSSSSLPASRGLTNAAAVASSHSDGHAALRSHNKAGHSHTGASGLIVDASLQRSLSRMIKRIQYKLTVGIEARFKNFGVG